MAAGNAAKVMPERMGQPFTLCFFLSELVEYSSRGEYHTPYGILQKIVESDKLILLFQNKVQFTVIDKAAFTRGTPEELLTFLRQLPIPYNRVKG